MDGNEIRNRILGEGKFVTSLFQILCLFRGVIFSADSGRTPRSAPDANVVFPAYIRDIFSYLAGIL